MMHALFICESQANGGWEDMICLGSIEECKQFADSVIESYGFDAWGHIVNLGQARIVEKFHLDPLYSKRMGGVVTAPSKIAWVKVLLIEIKGIL